MATRTRNRRHEEIDVDQLRRVGSFMEVIRDGLDELDAARRELAGARTRAMGIAGVLVLVSVLVAVLMGSPFPLIGAAVGIGSYIAMTGPAKSKVAGIFKSNVVAPLADHLHPGMTYYRTGLTEDLFVETRLFRFDHDIYTSEDGFVGTIGSTNIVMSEVLTEREERDRKGNTKRTQVFDGIVLSADFNKHFSGVTQVIPSWSEPRGWVQGARRVEMDDSAFEDQFNVFSTDAVEAHYILTPTLMNRIMHLARRWGRTDVRLTFHQARVSIAIPIRQDLFEFDSNDLTPVGKLLPDHTVGELIQCFSIVEDLDLNTRIWSKSSTTE